MSELVVRGLEKSFGAAHVLRGLDLAVPEGSLAAVLGPSGCGKTTLLRVVAGFERADAGEVSIGGRSVAARGRHISPERRSVGIVPQEGALFPHLSVAGNVGFGLPRRERRSGRVEEVLDLVGLGGFGQRQPAELSGGQQQRVALARALAPDPALVLLDEPFSALDAGLRAAVRDDVRAALKTAGATAVLVTHDQEESLSMADLVAVMADGRVVQAAPPEELYRAPADLGVATFVGDVVLLEAVLSGSGESAQCALGRLDVADLGASSGSAAGRVVVRPEQIQLGEPGSGTPARVTGVTFYGHDAMVRLELEPSQPNNGAVQVASRCIGGVASTVRSGDLVGVQVVGPVSFFAA